eukprot:c5539_g1_i2.p2 GENE.c5539_g1_i2~~c5539_g1_i2.p2  ORF type:complete len:132 (+),score=33.70 c5539_g1_i2:562-957(+)
MKLQKDLQDPSCLPIVMTGRPAHLHELVLGIINGINIPLSSNRLICKAGIQDTLNFKLEVLRMFMAKLKGISTLSVFEDREEHLVEFCSFAKTSLATGTFPNVQQYQVFHVHDCTLKQPVIFPTPPTPTTE